MRLLALLPLLLLLVGVHSQSVDDALFRLALKSFEPSGETSAVVSPFSLGMAMASVNLGANGVTSQEITDALFLGIEKKQIGEKFSECIKRFNEIRDEKPIKVIGYQEVVSNFGTSAKIDCRRTSSPRYRSLRASTLRSSSSSPKSLTEQFLTELEHMDFANSPKEQVARINDFVKNATSGKIEQIVDESSITDTKLLLVNALFLQMRFEDKFYPKDTKERFFTEKNEVKEVTMMGGLKKMECWKTVDSHVLETPDLLYVDFPMEKADFDFFLVLPKNQTLRELKQQLTSTHLNFSSVLKQRKAVCQMSATFEVDENGITAAAATALKMVPRCGLVCTTEPVNVRADRPFLYGVSFKSTPLFVGQFYGEKLPAFSEE
uniref:SERPIN domain-containing protein n=1 Tax=Steinernema glaseri TaxID=37863 RepID=A0A1I7ZS67_9BILA